MTTDTARMVAALRRLAEAEEACRELQGVPRQEIWGGLHSPICSCNGMGRVPFFRDAEGKTLFRKACVGVATWKESMPGRKDALIVEHGACCHDLGWLPLNVGEVHLEMLLLLAINNERMSLAGGQLFHTMMRALEARARSAKTEQDLIEAAILVLDAAMGARA